MAYDEQLAERVRGVLAGRADVTERRMFGGLTFMLGGNMCCGVMGDGLIVRLGPEATEQALSEPHVGPMDFTGRPMRGFVRVAAGGLEGDGVRHWVERGAGFASALPPKPTGH